MFTDILQPTHLIFILVVALLVLGPKRLPEVGRSLGNGLRDFRNAMSGIEDHAHNLTSPVASPTPPVTPATVGVPEEPMAPPATMTAAPDTTTFATASADGLARQAMAPASELRLSPQRPLDEPEPHEYSD